MSGQGLEELIRYEAPETEARTAIRVPRKYKVLLLNDDYTPMDFVVEVLKTFFHMANEKAVQIMLEVHTKGKGVCGMFTRDIAETKVALVNEYAQTNQHPLLASMEPE